jgi:peptidase E
MNREADMPADRPTILATSGGLRRGVRSAFGLGPLILHALELSGAEGRPRLCFVGTAGGDQRYVIAQMTEAGAAAGVSVEPLNLFPMPSVEDPTAYLLGFDAIWVGGGSVANLLALWRLHHLDAAFAAAWRAGVVLAGVSAGSICWHVGGTTDSFGPDLAPVTDGLGLVPFSNGVHYDSEAQRRPLFQRLIAEGALPAGYATDDGVGLVYHGRELTEVVTEQAGKAAYFVSAAGGQATEERLEPRLLPGS